MHTDVLAGVEALVEQGIAEDADDVRRGAGGSARADRAVD
jgi:hypothetical protein